MHPRHIDLILVTLRGAEAHGAVPCTFYVGGQISQQIYLITTTIIFIIIVVVTVPSALWGTP